MNILNKNMPAVYTILSGYVWKYASSLAKGLLSSPLIVSTPLQRSRVDRIKPLASKDGKYGTGKCSIDLTKSQNKHLLYIKSKYIYYR